MLLIRKKAPLNFRQEKRHWPAVSWQLRPTKKLHTPTSYRSVKGERTQVVGGRHANWPARISSVNTREKTRAEASKKAPKNLTARIRGISLE